MIQVYEKLCPIWQEYTGAKFFDATSLRHGIGYAEFAAAALLLTPLRKVGAGIALTVMGFAVSSHVRKIKFRLQVFCISSSSSILVTST
jgi:hypothetical protein